MRAREGPGGQSPSWAPLRSFYVQCCRIVTINNVLKNQTALKCLHHNARDNNSEVPIGIANLNYVDMFCVLHAP